MRRVRAKFRCLGLNTRWNNLNNAELSAVLKPGDGCENYDENMQFWEASPSGSCNITFYGPSQFKPGSYYYIDMWQDDDGDYTLDTIMHQESLSGVTLSAEWPHRWDALEDKMVRVSLEIQMSTDKGKAASESFDSPGKKWNVEFSLAGPPDDV